MTNQEKSRSLELNARVNEHLKGCAQCRNGTLCAAGYRLWLAWWNFGLSEAVANAQDRN